MHFPSQDRFFAFMVIIGNMTPRGLSLAPEAELEGVFTLFVDLRAGNRISHGQNGDADDSAGDT